MAVTLHLLKKIFYQKSEYGPAVLQYGADISSKGYHYSVAPSDLEFYLQILPEFMFNPGHMHNLDRWPNKTTLSYIMNRRLTDNGMKTHHQALYSVLLDPANVGSLISHCDEYIAGNSVFSHNAFQTVIRNLLQSTENEFQYHSVDQFLLQFSRIQPGAALACVLIYASLYKEDAYQCIRNYMRSESGKKLLVSCNLDNVYTDFNNDETSEVTEPISKDSSKESRYHFPTRYYFPDPIATFVGRTSYIARIMSLLHDTQEHHHVFLYGMSGIGKTELAKRYAATYRSFYHNIYMVQFQNSLKETICFGITLCNYDDSAARGNTEELDRIFREKLGILQQLMNEKDLLIIDNMNITDDPDLSLLLSQGFSVLITTQFDFSDRGYQTIQVHALESSYESAHRDGFALAGKVLQHNTNTENLSDFEEPGVTLALFQKIYGRELSEKDLMAVHHILNRFSGHTLITELLARQMRTSFLNASALADMLEKDGILGTKSMEQVSHQYSVAPKAVYDYISSIISPDSLTADEQYVLKNLAVLMTQGVPVRLFKKLCHITSYETIWKLKNRSLLILQEENDEEIISLHPLIRELVLINLTASANDFTDLLKNLASATANCWNEPRNIIAHYHDITLSALSKIKVHSEETLLSAASLLEFCWQHGHFDFVIGKCDDYYSYAVSSGYGHEVKAVICRVAGNCLYSTGLIYRKDSTRWFIRMLEESRQINDGKNSHVAYALKNIVRSELNNAIADFGLKIIPSDSDAYGYTVSSRFPYAEAAASVKEKLSYAVQLADDALNLLNELIAGDEDSKNTENYLSVKGDISYVKTGILLYLHTAPDDMLSDLRGAISQCYQTGEGLIRSLSITAAMTMQAKFLTLKKEYMLCDAVLNQAFRLEETFRGTEQNPHLIRILIAKGDSAFLQHRFKSASRFYREAKELIDRCKYLDKGRYYEEVSEKLAYSGPNDKVEENTFYLTSGI